MYNSAVPNLPFKPICGCQVARESIDTQPLDYFTDRLMGIKDRRQKCIPLSGLRVISWGLPVWVWMHVKHGID
ncbi:hypothetical protein AFLA_014016 [Aspergillus flavus NRRL3357]|nr:hypothetical protein AFLA_014016 [Aspergillus flavus NRRL3357]